MRDVQVGSLRRRTAAGKAMRYVPCRSAQSVVAAMTVGRAGIVLSDVLNGMLAFGQFKRSAAATFKPRGRVKHWRSRTQLDSQE